MKNIIKFFKRGLLIAMAYGGVWLGCAVSLQAAVDDSEVKLNSLASDLNSPSCVGGRDPYQGIEDCASLNKIALNGITAKVGWELNTEKLSPPSTDVGASDSITNPETSLSNRSSVILATHSDSQPQVFTGTATEPDAPLSLDGSMRGGSLVDNATDSPISEPLLTSIVALIAIVAVARRNVSGG